MENKKKNAETTNSQENDRSWFVANINTCISCGREIPEGSLVCMECEVGRSQKKCTLCDKPIAECESICANCKAIIFRSKNKD